MTVASLRPPVFDDRRASSSQHRALNRLVRDHGHLHAVARSPLQIWFVVPTNIRLVAGVLAWVKLEI
ncbi:unnamed protein product [Citrullus colocynthis]|uniref:Uncharacterized protein n=1 Tax=Citrullus colocynthis TaxID=252529 RepID=A0ABP0Z9J8_9ROSI